MADYACDFIPVQHGNKTFCHSNCCMIFITAGCKCIGHCRGHHIQPGHRHIRLFCQLFHQLIQFRNLFPGKRLCIITVKRNFITIPIANKVNAKGNDEHDHGAGAAPDHTTNGHQNHAEQSQKHNGFDSVHSR